MKVNIGRYKISEIRNWEPVEVFGKRCIFTSNRVDPKSLPKGFYMYECRHYDEDWGLCCEIAPHILVNFFGTIITNEMIPVDWDCQLLNVRNDDNQYTTPPEKFDIEWILEWSEEEILAAEKIEPIASNWIEYMEDSNTGTKLNIPDECIITDPSVLVINKFDDNTLSTIGSAVDIFSRDWKLKVVINIKDMSAKEINLIRNLFDKCKDYRELSSFYEQERLVFRCRPLEIEEISKRAELRKEWEQ